MAATLRTWLANTARELHGPDATGPRSGPYGVSRPRCILRYVLDDEFARGFVRRFSSRPDWSRPELWPVITDPARAPQRRWLSSALGQLPEHQRQNALARLQSDRHFLATYNELAAAALLSAPELRVEVEPSFTWQATTLTPDLALRSVDGQLLAIGEVSTRFRTAEHRSLEIQWRELRTRVARIPRPVGLLVQDLVHDPIRPPTSGQAAKIERGLRAWLLRPSIALGATSEFHGYLFQVAFDLPGLRAQVAAPTGGDWYNTDMVRGAISDKASRYTGLADSLDVPLLVVLAAEPALPLSKDFLASALAGVQALTVAFDPFRPGPIATGPMRLNEQDVPAAFHPALSAVGWLQPGIDQPGSMMLFDVPSAARTLTVPLGENVTRE